MLKNVDALYRSTQAVYAYLTAWAWCFNAH